MIKFIVLFVASVELAGHKARGLMLRGSRQILQPPYFSNSESQLDAEKSYLQVNKNNGKSLFKTNLYLQQDEQEQEQSYLQGKLTEEEIKRWIEQDFPDYNAENILKGLNRLTFEGPLDSHDHLTELLEKALESNKDIADRRQALLYLAKLESKKLSAEDEKKLSDKIHYAVAGHRALMRNLLQPLGEEKHTEEIVNGLGCLYLGQARQFQIMKKLVEKRLSGSPSEQSEAQEYIKNLVDLGSSNTELDPVIKDHLGEKICELAGENRKFIEHHLSQMGTAWNVENIDRGLNRLNLPSRLKQISYLETIKQTFFSKDPLLTQRARECLHKISVLGSRRKLDFKQAEILIKNILRLVKPKSA